VAFILKQENDAPESAVAKLFASAKVNGTEFTQYGMPSHCLQNFPSEEQMKVCINLLLTQSPFHIVLYL